MRALYHLVCESDRHLMKSSGEEKERKSHHLENERREGWSLITIMMITSDNSTIRITHLPTGTVVECQDQRSQHKNRAQAMSLLQSRLLTAETDKQNSEQAEQRRNLIGSGDRSERIRTYNYPQGRLTDHRINLTLYKLQEILEGDLNQVIEPLRHEYQADLLAAMGD